MTARSTSTGRTFAHTACVCAVLCAGAAWAGANKFIAAGWEFNDARPDTLLARADAMDKTPIDGCVLYLYANGKNGVKIATPLHGPTNAGSVFGEDAWDYADLEPLVPKYRKLLAHKSFRHSFLDCYRAPKKRVAWNDDAAWTKIAHNVRVIAKLAKASGFVGLRIDPEDYHGQRQYVRIDSDGMSYEELSALVRRRGRELFAGVFEEFPDVQLFSYFFLSLNYEYVGEADGRNLREIMCREGRSLWPHFIDGLFDVLPSTATLIEGNESAYGYRAERMDFFRAANYEQKTLVGLLAPENRGRYHEQMQTSFGLFLDGYSFITNEVKYGYYMEPLDGSRTRRLAVNLKQSVETADEYVWFWGARSRWASVAGKPTWKDAIPGLHETLLAVKSPAAFGQSLRLRMEAGELANLNTNSACRSESPVSVPKPYWTWQGDAKFRQGFLGCDLNCGRGDKVSLLADGVERGSFICDIDGRRPGEIVGVSFCSKGTHFSAMVGWRKSGKWDWNLPKVLIPVGDTADADGWTQTDWCVIVPDGADGFGLKFDVRQDASEKTWFDDVSVVSIGNL